MAQRPLRTWREIWRFSDVEDDEHDNSVNLPGELVFVLVDLL